MKYLPTKPGTLTALLLNPRHSNCLTTKPGTNNIHRETKHRGQTRLCRTPRFPQNRPNIGLNITTYSVYFNIPRHFRCLLFVYGLRISFLHRKRLRRSLADTLGSVVCRLGQNLFIFCRYPPSFQNKGSRGVCRVGLSIVGSRRM